MVSEQGSSDGGPRRAVKQPNWRRVVERIWDVVTEWEHDYEEGHHERSARACCQIIADVEEEWQDYSRWELETKPPPYHEHLTFLKAEARYYWHRYHLHLVEHKRNLWHQETRREALNANRRRMSDCFNRSGMLEAVIRGYEPEYSIEVDAGLTA
jgi:hypothetical protein